MSRLRNKSRLVVSLAVVGTLVLAMSGIAIAEGITIPGTDIQLPDVLPPGVTQVVENVTDAIPVPELPLPGTEAVEGVVNNVTGALEVLPVDDVVNQLPVLNSLPLPVSGDALNSVPAGPASLNLLSTSSLPSPDTLTDLLDPSQLPLPEFPTLGDLPIIGTLLDLLDPANLPGLDELPVIGAILPIVDSILDKLAEIPILKPIVEILEKLLVILRPVNPTPTPTPETPEAPTAPSANVPASVAGVESPAGDSFGHLPYTGADFTGVLFLIICLLASLLLVHKVEGSVRRTGFKKSNI
jgi:hypothetical protein